MTGAERPAVWSPEAEADLLGIWAHLAAAASPDIADHQLREIERAVAMLAQWPFVGRVRNELLAGLRSVPVHPYTVFYRVAAASLQIVRVLDGRRDIDAEMAN
jgi:toxin ParE1/3/4